MLGLIVQLAISWVIVWFYEKNDLRVLGFFPAKARLLDSFLFFVITAICCSTGFTAGWKAIHYLLGTVAWL